MDALFLRKYNTLLADGTAGGEKIRVRIRKAGSADFATGSDWTPASGDVKVSLDNGTQANVTNLPTYSNGSWVFILTAAELTAKASHVAIVDSATKAVDDYSFTVETFGHASAMYPTVYSGGAAGNLITSGTGTDQLSVAAGLVTLTAASVTTVQSGLATTANQTTIITHLTDVKGSGWVTGDNLHSRLDATVSSRMASFTYTAPDNATITAINAKTTNLPASPAAVGSAMTLTSGERTAVANEVEAQIIDETDSEKVLTAITDKIASVNPSLGGLTLGAIAIAVRDVSNASPAGNSLGAVLNAVNAKTANLPADPADASDVAAAFSTVNGTLGTLASYVDTEVGAIKAKTDNLPAAFPANFAAMLIDSDGFAEVDAHKMDFTVAGTTQTVKTLSGATKYTKTLTTDADAEPITGST